MFWNKRGKIEILVDQVAALQESVEQLRAQVTVIGGFVNADLARKVEGALDVQAKLNSGDIVMGEAYGF